MIDAVDHTDLLIIGAGSGAFSAAIRAAELGAHVTMIERGVIGGTCVNVGCVPSKTLIRAADVHHARSHHPFEGIPAGNRRLDLAALVAQKQELVERLRKSKYQDVLSGYEDIIYVEGEAEFLDPSSIRVRRPDEPDRTIVSDRIVIATGARTWVPSIPGIDDVSYWTNIEALTARTVPRSLAVAGGGPVGLELAQMFSRFGSKVSLIAPFLAPGTDPEVGEVVRSVLEAEGVDIIAPSRIAAVARQTDGGIDVVFHADGRRDRRVVERLIMATGRQGNTGALRLERAGVAVDDRGFVEVDSRLRTTQPGIYAVGDCATIPKYVYVAAKAGTIAAENALTETDRALDLSAMPAVIFTDPQVAWVGLTEIAASVQGPGLETRVLPMEEVPRALANRDHRGMVKLVARSEDRRLLGAQIVAPLAGEMIQTAVLAIQQKMSVTDLANTLFPYLTEVEGLRLAAQIFERKIEQLSCCAG